MNADVKYFNTDVMFINTDIMSTNAGVRYINTDIRYINTDIRYTVTTDYVYLYEYLEKYLISLSLFNKNHPCICTQKWKDKLDLETNRKPAGESNWAWHKVGLGDVCLGLKLVFIKHLNMLIIIKLTFKLYFLSKCVISTHLLP